MITALFSLDQLGGIGYSGRFPWFNQWHIDNEDWRWFDELTKNQVVILGSTSWQYWAHKKYPLTERQVIVFSHNASISRHSNVILCSGELGSELQKIQTRFPGKQVFVAGGADILGQSQNYLDEILLARRRGAWRTDAKIRISEFFQNFRLHSVRPGTECMFETWRRDTKTKHGTKI